MEGHVSTFQKINVFSAMLKITSVFSQANMPQARKLLRINMSSATFLLEAYLPEFGPPILKMDQKLCNSSEYIS
jgi:hypothetical protein